ncbi:MAG: sodium-dependent transporter, partial [Bacteroidales bacterium]|nr:sodium-dependent transporter [Bacteroidales bacterium]
MDPSREHFSSRFAVIMAMAGSAIGLGNIWRFPYMVGQYGGAAFIIVYILCCFLLSLPIFLSESIIGRRGG